MRCLAPIPMSNRALRRQAARPRSQPIRHRHLRQNHSRRRPTVRNRSLLQRRIPGSHLQPRAPTSSHRLPAPPSKKGSRPVLGGHCGRRVEGRAVYKSAAEVTPVSRPAVVLASRPTHFTTLFSNSGFAEDGAKSMGPQNAAGEAACAAASYKLNTASSAFRAHFKPGQ